MVNYTSCATTNESTGVLTVLELLIAGIDVELLVSGSEPLRSALALSLDRKKMSNVHDQLSFSLLHVLIVYMQYTEKIELSKCVCVCVCAWGGGGDCPHCPPFLMPMRDYEDIDISEMSTSMFANIHGLVVGDFKTDH